MVLIPPREDTISQIYASYVERQRISPPRTHLGASEIGKECARAIWYSFRWAKDADFPGQMLRLFDTGKLEEDRLIADLNAVGVDVKPFDPKTGKQYRMELFGGHFGGSLDGVCIGLVEAPKSWHVLEMKTHNDRSFKSLCEKGVRESKPEHFCQMQIYMGMSHEVGLPGIPPMDRAFYFAVNKNTDQLYAERVHYDGGLYQDIKARASQIIFAQTPPIRVSNNSDSRACKFCNYKSFCHKQEDPTVVPARSCRTCIHATPTQDGKWHGAKYDKILSLSEQSAGCSRHLYIPQLINAEQTDATDNSVIYTDDIGRTIINHEGGEVRIYEK